VALRFGVHLAPADRTTLANPVINSYRDANGEWFWIVGLEGDRHWPSLCRAIGRPEWIDDPRFARYKERAAHAPELIAMLDEIFVTKSREDWGAIFDAEEELWWAPVQSFDEMLADPQVRACGGLVEVPDGAGATLLPATPLDFEATPWQPRSMAPDHGEHTDDVLHELGRSDAEIAALRSRGVVV